MAETPSIEERETPTRTVLSFKTVGLSPEQFFRFCRDNPDMRIELTAQKEIIIMSPTGRRAGARNAEIIRQLANWAKTDGRGIVCDSDTLFTLPNGAKRSPDASWTLKSRADAVIPNPRDPFDLICPDFVLELWSPSDTLRQLQAKMVEYLENGARLGFLIYPHKHQVWIYRPNQEPECLEESESVSGDPELPGFTLGLTEIWK
jgi:Uma2 family endonuclease